MLHELENNEIDNDNLGFRDMTGFLMDRIKPDQIISGVQTLDLKQSDDISDVKSSFSSFKNGDDWDKKRKSMIYKIATSDASA